MSFVKDIELKDTYLTILLRERHIDFLTNYSHNKNEYETVLTEYLRLSGIYWGLTALELMDSLHLTQKKDVAVAVSSCQNSCGGFSPAAGHDPHMLYTLSAIQILCLADSLDCINKDKVVEYIVGLQQEDGSFYGDKWGEVDTRFSFCAVATLSLLGKLDAINVDKAVEFVLSCMNFDGGFGSRPGSESHAGLIYCALAFLSVTHRLDAVDADLLGWWLCERQLESGGLNGRPEKLPDVCYSWWVLSSLSILGRLHWVKKDAIIRFILACQKVLGRGPHGLYLLPNVSPATAAGIISGGNRAGSYALQAQWRLDSSDGESGGFSDRPGFAPDPFHTLFGLAGLSLLGEESLKAINPTYCLPQHVIQTMSLAPQTLNTPS